MRLLQQEETVIITWKVIGVVEALISIYSISNWQQEGLEFSFNWCFNTINKFEKIFGNSHT